MDTQQIDDEQLIINFFPDPPPFYKHFTSENQERIREIEKEAGRSDNDTKSTTTRAFGASLSAEQILALPTELQYLIPPEPPADDEEFTVFGQPTKAKGADMFMMNMEHISNALTLEQVFDEWKYEQLYPSAPIEAASQPDSSSTAATLDRQNYLLRFIRSIMLSYISLLGIVASDAASPLKNEKLKDILSMVANMHALINEYRPHQARETLIRKMEHQVERKKSEIAGVRRMADKVRNVLEEFKQEVEEFNKGDAAKSDEEVKIIADAEKRQESQSRMWEAMEEILG
ncbi:Mediator of RNA polymerase II transcription subunit 7 [Coniothyrium glycines]